MFLFIEEEVEFGRVRRFFRRFGYKWSNLGSYRIVWVFNYSGILLVVELLRDRV